MALRRNAKRSHKEFLGSIGLEDLPTSILISKEGSHLKLEKVQGSELMPSQTSGLKKDLQTTLRTQIESINLSQIKDTSLEHWAADPVMNALLLFKAQILDYLLEEEDGDQPH